VHLGRKSAGVHERGDLSDLHRGALHLAQHVEDALRGLQLALLGRGAALLVGAAEVCRAACIAAGGLRVMW
jgi:hypothetical protein